MRRGRVWSLVAWYQRRWQSLRRSSRWGRMNSLKLTGDFMWVKNEGKDMLLKIEVCFCWESFFLGCFILGVFEKDLGFLCAFQIEKGSFFFFERDTTLEKSLKILLIRPYKLYIYIHIYMYSKKNVRTAKDSTSPPCMRQFQGSLKMPFRGVLGD